MWANHSTTYFCKVKSCSWSLGGAGGGIVETQYIFLLNLSFPPFYLFADLCSQSEFSVPFLVTHFVHWYLLWVWLYICMPQGFSSYQDRDSVSQSCRSWFFSGSTHPCSGSFWVCLSPENLQTKTKFRSKEKCLYMWQKNRKKKNHSCSDQIHCQLIWKLY